MSIKQWKTAFQKFLDQYPGHEKSKAWLIPLGIAFLATLLLYGGIRSYKERLGYGMEAKVVLVAARALLENDALSPSDFAEKSVPKKLLPVGTLSPSDRNRTSGIAVKRPIPKGAIVFWTDLDVDYMPPVPARRISPGYRAISIPVDDVTSVAHSIRPGDHIDLISTVVVPGEDGTTTMTLLQNVTVLDIGAAEKKENGKNYSTVTLMVLPKEVSLITFAIKHGKLNIVLRNPNEMDTPKDLPLITMSRLFETAFRNSIQNERDGSTVEIIRDGKRSGVFNRSP